MLKYQRSSQDDGGASSKGTQQCVAYMPEHLRNAPLTAVELQAQCDRYSHKHFSASFEVLQAVARSAQGTPAWLSARRSKITGSVAGKVLKSQMSVSTDRGKVVASITNPKSFCSTKAMKLGLKREAVTIAESTWFLGRILGEKISSVHDVGLWTCEKTQFLASSVDQILHVDSAKCASCPCNSAQSVNDVRSDSNVAMEVKYHVSESGSKLSPSTDAQSKVISSQAYKTAPPAYYPNRVNGIPSIPTKDGLDWLALEGVKLGTQFVIHANGALFNQNGKFHAALLDVSSSTYNEADQQWSDPPKVVNLTTGQVVPAFKKASLNSHGHVLHPGSHHFLQVMHHLIAHHSCGRAIYCTSTDAETYIEMLYWSDWQPFVENWLIPQYTTFFTEVFLPELAWPSNAMGEEHVMDRSRKIALVAAEDARKRKALDVLEKQAQKK